MTRDLSHIPVLVPADIDDAADLPMGTLDAMSNKLGCDIVEAVRGNVAGKRYAAWAELAYQWARKSGAHKPDRETYRNYSAAEITHALGWDRPDEDDEDPTVPAGVTQTPTDASGSGSSE